jgi:SAM-dependent methyltransferase
MHKNALDIMTWFSEEFAPKGNIKVLDIGSQVMPHQVDFGTHKELFQGEYTGVDISEGINVDIILEEPYTFPFEDEHFDVVISSQTFEHIEFPWVTMQEINRVLKPNGMICIIAPAKAPLHYYPIDAYRYNPDGMKALAKWVGFETLSAEIRRADRLIYDCYLIAKKNG